MSNLGLRVAKLEGVTPAKQVDDVTAQCDAFIVLVRDRAGTNPDLVDAATPEASALLARWKSERFVG